MPEVGRPGPFGAYSDESRRAADVLNHALLIDRAANENRWVAIRLSDGGSDGTIYDCKCDAARHQLHEKQCMYVQILPEGITVRAADSLLQMYRRMYDANFKMQDPPCDRHGVKIIQDGMYR